MIKELVLLFFFMMFAIATSVAICDMYEEEFTYVGIEKNFSLQEPQFYENETELFTTDDGRFLVVRGEVNNLTMVEGENDTYICSLKMENPVTTKNGKENLPRIVSVLDSEDLYRFQIPINKDIPAEFIFDQRNNMTLTSSRVVLNNDPKKITTLSKEIFSYSGESFYQII